MAYRGRPINRGDHRTRSGSFFDDAWKMCPCEKRWTFKWALSPSGPKYPYSSLHYCDDCGAYGGPNGRRLKWVSNSFLCRLCRKQTQILADCVNGIQQIKAALRRDTTGDS